MAIRINLNNSVIQSASKAVETEAKASNAEPKAQVAVAKSEELKNIANSIKVEQLFSSNVQMQKLQSSAQLAGAGKAAADSPVAKVSVTPKHVAEVPKKNVLPNGMQNLGKDEMPGGRGQTIPGFGKSSLPGGVGKNGFPGMPGTDLPGFEKGGLGGGLGKQGAPGMPGGNSGRLDGMLGAFGKNGLAGMGKGDLGNGMGIGGLGSGESDSGMFGLAGFGSKKGPSIKMPGSDRMDGDPTGPPPGPPQISSGTSYGAGFLKGTWDFDSKGFTGSVSGGVTSHGYGAGMNDKGEVGVADGNHNGGSVTSAGDAQRGANNAYGGSNKNSGTPEGLNWSKGTHIKDDSSTKDSGTQPSSEPKKQEGPNDLGPTNNDPSKEKKNENETAVAQNDTTKNNQAGKPNPHAQPNPEDGGGGTPRSNAAHSSVFTPNPEDSGGGTPRSNVFTPNPEDSGGGTPRSNTLVVGNLFMPNPEDSGGGTPRSVIANKATKLRG